MSVVTLYGASDDLIEVEGDCSGCDEYNSEDSHFVLIGHSGASVRVRVWYTRRGLWAIAVAPTEEDSAMLPVEITGRGYTAIAVVPNVKHVIHEAKEEK